jgi:hypothetical protein
MNFSPPNLLRDSTGRKKAVFLAIALVVWSLFLWRAIDVFGPGGGLVAFNSDTAIPVLMSNDIRPITIFDTYYYGQDRLGAWPFIIARMVNHSTGFRWSDERLHAARSIWLFLGVLVLALLNRRAALPVILIAIMVICLEHLLQWRLFDIGQVYAWQITTLLLSWLSLRKWFEKFSEPIEGIQTEAERLWWSVIVFFFSLLAIWSSTVSGPLLCFLVGVECWRSIIKTSGSNSAGKSLIHGFKALCLILLAVFVEIFMRVNYHRYGLKHYQYDFETRIALDVGYLCANLKAHLSSLINFRWSPLILLPLVTVIAVGAVALYFWMRGRRDSLTSLRELFIDDTSFTIVGGLGIAAINFAIVALVDHVRISLYDDRYLTITYFFGSISGLLVIWRILHFALKQTKADKYAEPLFATVAFVLLIIAFPQKVDANLYKLQKDAALSLAQKSPNAVLMGGYWETYVFSALQPTNMLMPLPLEGYQVRMPWAIPTLQSANEVIVEYKHSKPGGAEIPPDHLTQYGDTLKLVDSRWYENSQYAFARYIKEPK